MTVYMTESFDINKHIDGENTLITTKYTSFNEKGNIIKTFHLFVLNEDEVLKFRVNENKEVEILKEEKGWRIDVEKDNVIVKNTNGKFGTWIW